MRAIKQSKVQERETDIKIERMKEKVREMETDKEGEGGRAQAAQNFNDIQIKL